MNPTPPSRQSAFSSPELGLSMTVPEGFHPEGSDPISEQTNVACFVTVNRDPWLRLCVERAGGGLPRNASQLTFAWKDQQLEGARFSSTYLGKTPVEVVAVYIPLNTKPVWLVGMAPAGKGNEAQATVVSTLGTLQGPVGETSAQREARMEKLGESFGTVAGVIMAIGVGMWIMKRRMTKQSKS